MIVKSGIGYSSSNPEWGSLHFVYPWECDESNYSSSAMGKL